MTTDPATQPAATPPEAPRVPRPPLSRTAFALAMFSAIVVGTYSWIAYADYEPGSPDREKIPASVRSSPGGYRTYHFWHSGYHGGK
jgi:hypothetical protein